MPVTPRRQTLGDPETLERLRVISHRRAEADADLRWAVNAARKSGASIRVIAEHSGLSTDTVQKWLKQD